MRPRACSTHICNQSPTPVGGSVPSQDAGNLVGRAASECFGSLAAAATTSRLIWLTAAHQVMRPLTSTSRTWRSLPALGLRQILHPHATRAFH